MTKCYFDESVWKDGNWRGLSVHIQTAGKRTCIGDILVIPEHVGFSQHTEYKSAIEYDEMMQITGKMKEMILEYVSYEFLTLEETRDDGTIVDGRYCEMLIKNDQLYGKQPIGTIRHDNYRDIMFSTEKDITTLTPEEIKLIHKKIKDITAERIRND